LLTSSNLPIKCIFLCRALIRPLLNLRRETLKLQIPLKHLEIRIKIDLCLAAMHLIWSSKTKRAANWGNRCAGLREERKVEDVGELWTVTCKQRESSLSPVTSTSYSTEELDFKFLNYK